MKLDKHHCDFGYSIKKREFNSQSGIEWVVVSKCILLFFPSVSHCLDVVEIGVGNLEKEKEQQTQSVFIKDIIDVVKIGVGNLEKEKEQQT